MRLLINGLSSTNPSGRQVLCGHLAECLRQTPDTDRYVLLLHAGNADAVALLEQEWGGPLPERLQVRRAPAWTAHWFGRTVYERLFLGRLAAEIGADAALTLSGGWTAGLPCPQYTLALNPWALAPVGARSAAERLKAVLQRRAYRVAVRHAAGIGYGSVYMRDLYRANARRVENAGAVVYPALGRREVEALEAVRARSPAREPLSILCVSVMAPHKDIATLVEALNLLRGVRGIPARLRLVGGWPDAEYRRRIEALVAARGLSQAVEITGAVERAELRRAYGAAQVYALLSRSESFGIPAIEAQRMGTPVVAANCCAAPEVCGKGGLYVAPGDAAGAARALETLLADVAAWQRLSGAARENALRFEYRLTTRPLLAMLGLESKEPDGV